jgi:hypothetical protein
VAIVSCAESGLEDWPSARGRYLHSEILQQPPDVLTATRLNACIAAASQHAIELALVSAGGLVPGSACQECGALSGAPGGWLCRRPPGYGPQITSAQVR